MGYDERLAERVRTSLARTRGVTERKMFGGICFLVGGKMAIGVNQSDLVVRVGRAGHEAALKEPGARPMDFTGRPLTGLVYVAKSAVRTEPALKRWVDRGVTTARATTKPNAGKAAGAERSLKRRRA